MKNRTRIVSAGCCILSGWLMLNTLPSRAQTYALTLSSATSTYGTMPHQSHLTGLTNITAEVWINTTESTGPRFFFSKYNSSNRTTGGEWYMGLESGGTAISIMIVPGGSTSSASRRTFSLLPHRYDDGKWHHVAFTYNEARIEAFFNGVSLGVNTLTTGTMLSNEKNVNVGVIHDGASPATTGNSFVGLMAEARMWNTIRTEAQIRENMHRRLQGNEPGLIGYWPLNEGAGTALYDRTPANNHGTLVGASRTSTDLVIGFILANPETGSRRFINGSTAAVVECTTHADYTHVQITEGSTPPDPLGWEPLAQTPGTVTFTNPESGQLLSMTAWFTNMTASVVLLSDTARLTYAPTTLPSALAHETLNRDISPIPGSSVVIPPIELDAGSTGGTFNDIALDIVDTRVIQHTGTAPNATPDERYATLTSPGTYELALVVRNEAGNVATSAVCTVTVTATAAHYVVPAPIGNDANDGASWGSAWATLNHAVATAPAGDLILVTNGVHSITNTLLLDKPITLMGFGSAPSETRVKPASTRINLVVLSHADARVENLTLQSGSRGAELLGGGTLARCLVTGCDNTGVYLLNGGLVTDSVISNNTVNGSGGGARLNGGGSILRNCLIVNNRATGGSGFGGGIFFENGGIASEALAEFCTIVNNYAIDSGGGVRVAGNDQGTLRNCIVWNNRALIAGDNGAGNIRVFNTLLAPARTRGGSSVDADPRFVAPGAEDFRLRPDSPAIDAGATANWIHSASLDLDGNPRTDGGLPDMGAYEYQTVALDAALFPDRRAAFLPEASVTFHAQVRGLETSGLTYAWDFTGDGQTDLIGPEADTPVFVYTEAGNWTVTLTVSNSLGQTATHVWPQAVQTGPAVVHVSPGGGSAQSYPYAAWETAAGDIQTAIHTAVSGAVVRVASGTYLLSEPVRINTGITLQGEPGAVLDGQATVSCLYLEHPTAIVDGLTIRNGLGNPVGGVELFWGGTLRNSIIEDNACLVTASGGVGGVRAYGSQCLVSHCIIRRNFGGGSSGGGGAQMARGATIRNCLVTGNRTRSGTGWNAGGIMLLNGAFVDACTVVGNETFLTEGAGGVYSRLGISSTMQNSIVYFNRHNGGDNHDVANGFISGSGNNIVGSLATASNLSGLTDNPRFRRDGSGYGESFEPGNYRLKYDSHAVNAGVVMDWMAGGVDLDGKDRIVDGAVDIGAYECQPPLGSVITVR